MKKRLGDIIFTSYDIAEIFDCRDDSTKITKAIRKDNQNPVSTGNQYGSGYGSYFWNLDNITENVFKNIVESKILNGELISSEDFKSIIELNVEKFKEASLTKKEVEKLKKNPIVISEDKINEENRLNLVLKSLIGNKGEFNNYIAVEKKQKAIEKKAIDDELNRKRLEEYIKIGGNVKAYLEESWFSPRDTKYIIHCGDTNSGKTYHAMERMKETNKSIYLAPLRLLAWEVAEKINHDFNELVCSLITGEEKIYVENERFVSATIEMMDYSTYFDVVIIDEAFMIGDRSRGKAWLKAIAEAKADEVHIIVNKEAVDLITNILTILGRNIERKDYERLVPLVVPKTTKSIKEFKDKTIFVVFDRQSALETKRELEQKGYNVSILYGNLPPEVRKEQMSKFISGKNKLCVSTDVIGMGINLPCDNIYFKSLVKFDGISQRILNSSEIRQIGGRAGRYGLSTGGFVYSCDNKSQQYIKDMMNKVEIISDAKFGLDFNIFDNIPKNGYVDKLTFFSNIDPIPERLNKLIRKQSVDDMCSLAYIVDRYNDTLTNEEAWNMITLPVKKNLNMDYFTKSINNYVRNGKIKKPQNYSKGLMDQQSLFCAETCASEFDLFLYMSNNHIISKKIDDNDVELVKNERLKLINRINIHLADKKNCGIKRCLECKTILTDTNHKLCYDCYSDKIDLDYN